MRAGGGVDGAESEHTSSTDPPPYCSSVLYALSLYYSFINIAHLLARDHTVGDDDTPGSNPPSRTNCVIHSPETTRHSDAEVL